MYPTGGRRARRPRRFPRTRGDVPDSPNPLTLATTLPPHTRGCTSTTGGGTGGRTASPAHAGMYPRPRSEAGRGACFPRTRGDVPRGREAAPDARGLPPHTRGCTRRRAGAGRDLRASPAHAGMYLGFIMSDGAEKGFPRTRGDVPLKANGLPLWAPLPPHTRGCTAEEIHPGAVGAASPAHAGMYR